jgi:hypothetical protein
MFYIHDCVTNYNNLCKIERYMYLVWLREQIV